jgi:hypothetical protein
MRTTNPHHGCHGTAHHAHTSIVTTTGDIMACLRRLSVVFPPPMGALVFNFVKRDGFEEGDHEGPAGPLVAFEEVKLKFFGPGSKLHIGSETLRKDLNRITYDKGYHEVCSDPVIISTLARAGVVGRTAAKVCLLSVDAIISLLQRRGAGPAWIQPLRSLDLPNMFADRLSGAEDEPLYAPQDGGGPSASPTALARALAKKKKTKRKRDKLARQQQLAEEEHQRAAAEEERAAQRAARRAANRRAKRLAKQLAAGSAAAQEDEAGEQQQAESGEDGAEGEQEAARGEVAAAQWAELQHDLEDDNGEVHGEEGDDEEDYADHGLADWGEEDAAPSSDNDIPLTSDSDDEDGSQLGGADVLSGGRRASDALAVVVPAGRQPFDSDNSLTDDGGESEDARLLRTAMKDEAQLHAERQASQSRVRSVVCVCVCVWSGSVCGQQCSLGVRCLRSHRTSRRNY